jgi:hypothetical protein
VRFQSSPLALSPIEVKVLGAKKYMQLLEIQLDDEVSVDYHIP